MLGRDVNSSPTQYRTWVVNNAPDFDGYYYTGLKSGPEPFIDVSAYTVADGYAVVDFNLPNPLEWITSYRTMSEEVYNSQFAILDGYAYMFGGTSDGYGEDGYGTISRIFRMDLNNPADWEDTGATLPGPLCLSSFAIVGSIMYLFGGFVGGGPTDVIYYAPIASPLNWSQTISGANLPKKIYGSSIAVTTNFLYMYGGFEVNFASEVIFRAPTSNPTSWTLMGNVLPTKLYNSTIAYLNGDLYLLGGMLSPDNATSNIYKAAGGNPLSWTIVGTLPASSCNSQFFTVAGRGYLIGPTTANSTTTAIFRLKNISSPLVWENIGTAPMQVARSQMAIIGDRLYFFGGNGSTAIWVDYPLLKYKFDDPLVLSYGSITRTQYDAVVNPIGKIALLGFPYWRTDY